MENIKVIALGLLFTILTHADCATNNTTDITVVVPGERHKSTPRQLATMTVWTDINKYLPQKSPFTTLGSLITLCDHIVLANVHDISYESDNNNGFISKKAKIVFNMQVEKLIFGDLDTDNLSVKFNNYLRVLPVKKGDKVLLFLADYQWYEVDGYELSKWTFDYNSILKHKTKSPLLIFFYEGMVNVTDERERDQIIGAVKGYLNALRKSGKDPDEYYFLLSNLLTSNLPIIKENAIQDMKSFCQSYTSFDVERAMNDPNLEDGMKKLIYYHSQPSRAENLVDVEMQRMNK